jgi:signal transduction histidine kinase/ActR/RegA family two-component response regulator
VSDVLHRSRPLAPAHLRGLVLWAGVALIALIIAADAYEGWQDRRAALARSGQNVALLSGSLADQTTRVVQDLDFALGDFADWAATPAGATLDPDALRAAMQARIARFPYVHSVAVFDANGRLRASTRPESGAGANVSGREIFIATRDAADDRLHVGAPWTSATSGYRTFSVTRRFRTPDGAFAGIVVARVAFEYLARVYVAVDVDPGTFVRLRRDDGVELARFPDQVPGNAAPGGAVPARATPVSAAPGNAAPDAGVSSTALSTDAALDTVVSRRPTIGYPLEVVVAQPTSVALAAWRQQEIESAFRTGTLVLLAAALLAALSRALHRREEAELARRESEARLEEARKAEALSLLAASVAHDFNNVLSAIVGYAELARTGAPGDEASRTWLERLLTAAERARALVRRVLTFDPNRALHREPVNLAPIVREVREQLLATRPKTLVVDVAPRGDDAAPTDGSDSDEDIEVLGDPTEVYQILMNLATNAADAMQDSGTLRIGVERIAVDETRILTVGELAPGTWVVLSVVDTGAGLAPERLVQIFDPLYTTKAPGSGTGIGLTVVRNIVRSMQGAIEVESTPGVGTRFAVYLPPAPPRTASIVTATPEPARPSGTGQTVLIVDDEPDLVLLAEEITAGLGYEPIGFSDPQRALDWLSRQMRQPDAIVTDERMPGLRGTEFARAARALHPDVPIVMVTAYRSADLDVVATECGIVAILDKPLRGSALEAALRGLMHGRPIATETERKIA